MVRVSLARYGLPLDYAKHDHDDCTAHVIGYRSLVWFSDNLLAVVFNTGASCRTSSKVEVTGGTARLLVFDGGGHLKAKRDVAYGADGGDEMVAPGDAVRGPDQTLVLRIEEGRGSKSGEILFNPALKELVRIDRFMELSSVIDPSLVFQRGFVLNGPRTYDVVYGLSPSKSKTITENLSEGAMASKVGRDGYEYALCQQELAPNEYRSSNVVYAGVHRRCVLHVKPSVGPAWTAALGQDEVADILGTLEGGDVVGIVRRVKEPDRLVRFSANSAQYQLPWFPAGYETELQSIDDRMDRYQGFARKQESKGCSLTGVGCDEAADGRLMIFDRSSKIPLVNRRMSQSARVAISPNGRRYATFEAGELRIYSLQGR